MYLASFGRGFHSLATLKLTPTPLEGFEEGEKGLTGSNSVAAKSKDHRSGF